MKPIITWLLFCLLLADLEDLSAAQPGSSTSPIFPDYVGVTIPPNIAPLNFRILSSGTSFRAELRSTHGAPLTVANADGVIRIPLKPWKRLLKANRGQLFYWELSARESGAEWKHLATITNRIAEEEIDSYLAYRLLRPLYNSYVHLGIYQRDLETFEQRPILENSQFNNGCLNCHTPLNRSPNTFAFNTRGAPKEQPMILVISNQVARVDKTMGYLAWHPSGRLIAFSANKLSLFFHSTGETRDVYDERSDLGIYRVDSNLVVFPPSIALTNRNETWPTWSPDGCYLYYSSAAPAHLDKFRHIRYDLMRAHYNLETDQWGSPETIVSSQETGQSACQPKVSPDGRWLVFTMCKYGNFPIYQRDSDLYLMDLSTRQFHRLEINSDQADSWHSWSSNSRWLVFSSKRLDGLFARPHISYVDGSGAFHKPFILPQEDPQFYESYLKTFNVPELMQGPVTVASTELARAVLHPRKTLVPARTGIAPPEAPKVPSLDRHNLDPQQMHE